MYRALKAEILKSQNSFAVWLSLAGTAANLVLFFVLHLFGQESIPLGSTPNPWTAWIDNHYAGVAFMMLPLYVIILAALVYFMEHRHDMWTQLYALPVQRWHYYLAKMLFTLLLFFAAHVLFMAGLLLGGGLLGLLKPGSGLLRAAPPLGKMLILASKTHLSILGLLALQSWISWRFPHFIVSLLIGILGFVLSGLLGPDWPWIHLIPWAPPMVYMPACLGEVSFVQRFGLTAPEWSSLAYALLFTALGWWSVRRRQVTSRKAD